METRESNSEKNFATLSELYQDATLQEQEIIDSLRETVKKFLDKETVDMKGLQAALKTQKIPTGLFSGDGKQELARLLKIEIKEKTEEKKQRPKVGDIIEVAGGRKARVKGFIASPEGRRQLTALEYIDQEPEKDEPPKEKQAPTPEMSRGLELTEQQKELLGKVDQSGRLGVTTSVSIEFASGRKTGSGFQTFIDVKSKNENANSELHALVEKNMRGFSYGFMHGNNIDNILEKENINAAVTIEPIIENVPIYEKKIVQTGMWPWKKGKEITEQVGVEEKGVAIGALNGKNKETEQAYRILYYVRGTQENPYIEGGGPRSGNMFRSCIVLSESVAKECFVQIEKNPGFVKEILRKLDPKLMESQEDENDSPQAKLLKRGPMPKINKIVIVPDKESFYIKECAEF